MKKLTKVLDNILLIIILLSVVQLVLGDLGIIYWGDSKLFRQSMVYSAFLFDLIFSIEFIARSISALSRKGFKDYFFYNRGWVDLLASLPLLLFNSGPLLFIELFQHTETGARSIVNLLKLIKAIRVTRILRVLRLLKIFGRIENVFSNMVQHHIASVSSIMVVTSIVIFMLLHFGNFIAFDDAVMEARLSLLLTTILVGCVVVLSVVYSAHFARTVADPIYVMKRGFKEEEYNFAVKIHNGYKNDEIFDMAVQYNKLWLPLKVKLIDSYQKKQKSGSASGDDYSDLL
jgi:hypothetical protein